MTQFLKLTHCISFQVIRWIILLSNYIYLKPLPSFSNTGYKYKAMQNLNIQMVSTICRATIHSHTCTRLKWAERIVLRRDSTVSFTCSSSTVPLATLSNIWLYASTHVFSHSPSPSVEAPMSREDCCNTPRQCLTEDDVWNNTAFITHTLVRPKCRHNAIRDYVKSSNNVMSYSQYLRPLTFNA